VESGVHYVQRNFMGGRSLTTFHQPNREVRQWCEETAGLRIHGTTKKQPRLEFEQIEKGELLALPTTPYELSEWKNAKVGRDCYVNFAQSYYSVPHRLVRQTVWLGATLEWVRIYNLEHQLLTTHRRAHRRGERLTQSDHLPPAKLAGLYQNRERVLEEAEAIGQETLAVVEELLADKVLDHTPVAAKILGLAQKAGIGGARLEAACGRARSFGEAKYLTIKRILQQHLESGEVELDAPKPVAAQLYRYSRSSAEIFGRLFTVVVVTVTSTLEMLSKLWN
jgi:hypothetical protein